MSAWDNSVTILTASGGLLLSGVNACRAALRGDGELAIEIFYIAFVTPWLRLKPDLQFVHDPSGRAGVDDAWVFTLRSAITF